MPIPGDFHVEICDWAEPADRQALLAVRDEVFLREQKVPINLERDADDARSKHVLARAPDGAPIATGRVTPDGVIGRMAVLRDRRRRGVGTAVLRSLFDLARARRHPAVTLHAQCSAVPFYQRYGFSVEGEEFEEAGIAHVGMRSKLAPFAAPQRPSPPPVPRPLPVRTATPEELAVATQTLLSHARHGACIVERELRAPLLDDAACLAELKRLAVSGRHASIRILVQDLTHALQDDTRLLALAQRLPSAIEMRRPVERPEVESPSAFLCVDTQGYLFRPLARKPRAAGSLYAPGRHAQLRRCFDDAWLRAAAWPELRVLDV